MYYIIENARNTTAGPVMQSGRQAFNSQQSNESASPFGRAVQLSARSGLQHYIVKAHCFYSDRSQVLEDLALSFIKSLPNLQTHLNIKHAMTAKGDYPLVLNTLSSARSPQNRKITFENVDRASNFYAPLVSQEDHLEEEEELSPDRQNVHTNEPFSRKAEAPAAGPFNEESQAIYNRKFGSVQSSVGLRPSAPRASLPFSAI